MRQQPKTQRSVGHNVRRRILTTIPPLVVVLALSLAAAGAWAADSEWSEVAWSGHLEHRGGWQADARAVEILAFPEGVMFSSPDSAHTSPRNPWSLDLVAEDWGSVVSQRHLGPAQLEVEGAEIELRWPGLKLSLSFAGAISQRFAVEERPSWTADDEPLMLKFKAGGTLRSSPGRHGRSVLFLAPDGGSAPLEIRGLVVRDADGLWVPAWFDFDGATVRLVLDDSQSTYPISGRWTWVVSEAEPESGRAKAATITVDGTGNSLSDGNGSCSIAEAIANANADSQVYNDCAAGNGEDTILFEASVVSSGATMTTVNDSSNGNSGCEPITTPIIIEGDGITIDRTASNTKHFLVGSGGMLTIRNTTLVDGADGALLIENGGTVVLENVTVNNASNSNGAGGAISVQGPAGTLIMTDSVISNSSANTVGGAIETAGQVTIRRSVIEGNVAGAEGGAIHVSAGNVTVENSVINGNNAVVGGGIAAGNNSVSVTLLHCTLSANGGNPGQPAAIARGASDTVVVRNSIVYPHPPASISGGCIVENTALSEAYGGPGNVVLASSPFVSLPAGPPPSTDGDFHLVSGATTVIDGGDNAQAAGAAMLVDWEGDFRFRGSAVDMGADEYDACNVGFPATVNDSLGLRAAVDCANLLGGARIIDFAGDVQIDEAFWFDSGNNAVPAVTGDIIVNGTGRTLARSLVAMEDFRFFIVLGGGSLTLDNLSLVNATAVDSSRLTTADGNGGVVDNWGTLIVRSGSLLGNSAEIFSSAILTHGGAQTTVLNVVLSGNANSHSCLANFGGTLDVVNTSIAGNTGNGIRNSSGTATVANSIIWGNEGNISDSGTMTVDSSGVEGGWGGPGTGNIDLESMAQLFIQHSPSDFAPTEAGDYHLVPSFTNPALDSGDPSAALAAGLTTDFEGDLREIGLGVDLGADEIGDCGPLSAVANSDQLRFAITCANQTPGPDQILFQADIELQAVDNTTDGNNGLPTVTSEISVQGGGRSLSRDPQNPTTFRLLYVDTAGALTLTDLTLAGGSAQDTDGGTINDYEGGAIYNRGQLTMERCRLVGNEAAGRGGALHAYYDASSTTITNSWFVGNAAVANGGAIIDGTNATISLTNTTIAGNSGGGQYSRGHLTVANSLYWGNEGIQLGGDGDAVVDFTGVEDGLPGAYTGALTAGNTVTLTALSQVFFNPLPFDQSPSDAGDYHLDPAAANPAIGAGNNALIAGGPPPADIDGDDRVLEGSVDLGADEARASFNQGWALAGFMTAKREGHTATLLPDGRVIVIGGEGDTTSGVETPLVAQVEIWDPSTGEWTEVEPLPGTLPLPERGRGRHTATTLHDGRILMVGGAFGLNWGTMDECLFYDPSLDVWAGQAATLTIARASHTATLLGDGRVLVTGGCVGFSASFLDDSAHNHCTDGVLSDIETFDPTSGLWTEGTPMTVPRFNHTATLLPSGKVVVVGGCTGISVPGPGPGQVCGSPSASAEIYDPVLDNWTEVIASQAPMSDPPVPRTAHTATLLPSGEVVVAGGDNLGTIQMIHPLGVGPASTPTWDPGRLDFPPGETYYHSATLLPEGNLLFVGGCASDSMPCDCLIDCRSSALTFDPRLPEGIAWDDTYVGDPLSKRPRASATLLPGGTVLVTGYLQTGGAPTEVYLAGDSQPAPTGSMNNPRSHHASVLLTSGDVMVIGGLTSGGVPTNTAELFSALSGVWVPAANTMSVARTNPEAILLQDGRVFVVGGAGSTAAKAEIFTPPPVGSAVTGTWSAIDCPGPDVNLCPFEIAVSASLLPSGKVLVLNGREGYVYEPDSGQWSLDPGRLLAVRGPGFEAALLSDSRALVLGGGSYCPVCTELYDPISAPGLGDISSDPTGVLNDARVQGFSTTLLPSGQVLVAGGWVSGQTSLDSAEIYDPASGTWTLTTPMNEPRRYHSAILLPSGKVLVSGGQVADSVTILDSQEIFDPGTASWTTLFPGQRRAAHSVTMVPDGRVLYAGGTSQTGDINSALPQVNSQLYAPNPSTPSRQPLLGSISQMSHSTPMTVTGTGLGGDSEATGGGRSGSAVNRPVFSVLNIHTGLLEWLNPDALAAPFCAPPAAFCGGEISTVTFSSLPSTLDPGLYLMTTWASGVPSPSRFASMDCSLEFAVQPADTTVAIGDTGTFSVVADGGRFYRWFKCVSSRCGEISGATSSTYVTDVISGSDTGTSYFCEVDSGCVVMDSDAATLTVADSTPPTVSVVAPSGGEYWLLSDTGQPANTEVVTWSMSDDVRICKVDAQLICSSDGGSNWIDVTSGSGLPATFGSGGTCAFPGEGTSSATYEVPTSAPAECGSGALYMAQVAVTDHAGNATTATSTGAFYLVQPNPDSISTLILHNLDRMRTVMGLTVTQTAAVSTKLYELADHPLVEGWVVDLGAVSAITTWYTAWDASSMAPTEANDLLFGTNGIHDYLINDLLTAFPNVANVVVVGDDRIIPFARITDGAALLLESEYTVSGTDLTATGTSVGKAIAAGYYLSDDPLVVMDDVAVAELDDTLFTADMAVGRLIEQPDEIIGTIATFISQDGGLDLTSRDPGTDHWVLVSGYDFLIDSANTVMEEWKTLLGVSVTDTASFAPIDASLVSSDFGLPGSSGFDADDRAAALLEHIQGGHDDPPGGPYGVINLNGHATHYETGVPGTGTFDIQGLDASMIAGTDLSGTVAYGVGCHAGLVVAGSVDANDHPQDLPQTMLAAGAVAYVANTGYGWGLVSGIGYGERLVQLLTEELTAGGSVAFGEAVRRAKLRYVLESPSFDQYDVKSLHQWTLFGLPMYTLRVSSGTRAARPFSGAAQDPEHLPAQQQLGEVVVDQRIGGGGAGDRALPDYLTQLSLSFNLSAAGVYTKKTAAGLTTTESGCSDPDGCYYLLNGLVQRSSSSSDLPLQPYLTFDSRLSGTSQHGVLWMGGTYDEETGWVPVFADLVSNAGTDGDHGAAPKHSLGSPSSLGNLDGPSPDDCRLVDYETSSLVVTAGEAVDASGLLLWDVERIFSSIDLESLYYNNSSDSTFNCDRTGPEFGVEPFTDGYHELVGTVLSFQVPVSDLDAAVWRVVIVYNDEAQDAWLPLELTEDAGSWIGSLELLGTEVTTYMIQAVDARGNVNYVPYVPTSLPTSGVDIDLPDTVDLPFIFGDGFESGDVSLWTSTAL